MIQTFEVNNKIYHYNLPGKEIYTMWTEVCCSCQYLVDKNSNVIKAFNKCNLHKNTETSQLYTTIIQHQKSIKLFNKPDNITSEQYHIKQLQERNRILKL